ncbi:MAG: hypothetical protein ACOX55_05305 [Christensenellales bacterium]
MFENPGRKIKGYATWITSIGFVASVVGAISIWDTSRYTYRAGCPIAVGFLVLIGGTLSSWIAGLFVYGFGQLIDDTQAIRRSIEK